MTETYTEVTKRLMAGGRNPSRWINIGGSTFQWKQKKEIQAMQNLMCQYIKELEEKCQQLVEKNNELLSQKGVNKCDAVEVLVENQDQIKAVMEITNALPE